MANAAMMQIQAGQLQKGDIVGPAGWKVERQPIVSSNQSDKGRDYVAAVGVTDEGIRHALFVPANRTITIATRPVRRVRSRSSAKQRLRSHIVNYHHRLPAKSWTEKQLADWHSRQHHRYSTNHYHAGSNTGPDDRPPGWRTGEDAVRKG